MKKGFTLLEMLVVIGIIAILTGTSIAAYSHLLRAGENARARELVSQVATALTALFNAEEVWPEKIRALGAQGGLLDAEIAYCLKDHYSVAVDSSTEKANGHDRFGIVTPWAQTVIKRLGSRAESGSPVRNGVPISDHVLHFAVDLDGDGIINDVNLNNGQGRGRSGKSFSVRATAIVWSCNVDGKILDYETGIKKDGIYSWTYGQTQKVDE